MAIRHISRHLSVDGRNSSILRDQQRMASPRAIAIVTGASRGFGRAGWSAHRFYCCFFTVFLVSLELLGAFPDVIIDFVLVARDMSGLQQTADLLRSEKPGCTMRICSAYILSGDCRGECSACAGGP